VSADTIALRLTDLCKSFGQIRAVDHLSLDVRCGEMTGFLGPNGAGKSTTLYMIPRLVHPSAGKVEIFGHDTKTEFKAAMQQTGTMFETPAFYEYLTGRKNLELVARLRGGVTAGEIDEILERVGLYERRKDKVRTYSHGMKQRLGLGMALLGRPRLLLLDEPTNGMDPEGTRQILGFLRQCVEEDSLAVFISSHLLYEIQEYCDTVFVINRGRLVASGRVSEILAPHESVVRVTFGGSGPDCQNLSAESGIVRAEVVSDRVLDIVLSDRDSAWLNRLLVGRGYEVMSLSPRQKTLKKFFLSITGENDA